MVFLVDHVVGGAVSKGVDFVSLSANDFDFGLVIRVTAGHTSTEALFVQLRGGGVGNEVIQKDNDLVGGCDADYRLCRTDFYTWVLRLHVWLLFQGIINFVDFAGILREEKETNITNYKKLIKNLTIP